MSLLDEYQGTYLVIGPPGTGKTTFLSRQIARFAQACRDRGETPPVLVVSLTKAAATELAGRDLPIPKEQVGTLHSLAWSAIGRTPLVDTEIDDWNKAYPQYRMEMAGSAAVDDLGSEGIKELPVYQDYQLKRHRMKDRDLWSTETQVFARKWEKWKDKRGVIDFTDMIEHALLMAPSAPHGARIIIADEAQDLSRLEYALLQAWAKHAQALLLAGDPWQALYVWRGAHPGLLQDPAVPDDHRRVLGQSYRVSRAVQDVAMIASRGLPGEIEYKPRDCEGVIGCVDATWREPKRLLRAVQRRLAESDSETVMILATCGYFLGPTIKMFKAEGVWFANPWKRSRGDWNPLAAGRGTSFLQRLHAFLVLLDEGRQGSAAQAWFGWTMQEITLWSGLLKAKGTLRHGMKKLLTAPCPEAERDIPYEFYDLEKVLEPEAYDSLFEVCAGYNHTFDALVGWLLDNCEPRARARLEYARNIGMETLSRPPRLYVGTVHSVKGGEADTVYMFPDVSPQAKDELARLRTAYVGITRARQRFFSCAPDTDRLAIPLRAWVGLARQKEMSCIA